jgi:hypothetical protein
VTRRRAQSLLGLSAAEAELLTSRARGRLGRRGYGLRAAAFLLATAPLARSVIPAGLRRRAIRPFVWGLLPGPSENHLYAVREWDGGRR